MRTLITMMIGAIVFPVFLFLAVHSFGVSKSNAQQLEHKQEYKDLYNNPEVALELIGVSADGKVKWYRLYDHTWRTVCYTVVGELHGKTVSNQCYMKHAPLGWEQK